MLSVIFRNVIVGMLVYASLFFALSVSYAQLPHTATWSSTGLGNPTVTDTTYGVEFMYNYPYTNSYEVRVWEFSTIATETETLSYNWNYTGLHAWYNVRAEVIAFVDHNEVRTTTVLNDDGVSGSFDMTGTSSLQLTAGDTYGFIITGYNYDSSKHLNGILKIQTSPIIKSSIIGTKGSANWYKSDVEISWAITDIVGREATTSGCEPTFMNEDTSTEGATYTCQVTTVDGTTSRSITIQRDANTPITSNNAPEGIMSTDTIVTLEATDSGSGVAHTFYKINGGTIQEGNQVNLTTDGVHSINYWSIDHAGNVESLQTVTITIDKQAYETATLQADITVPTASDVTVTVTYPTYATVRAFSVDNQTWDLYEGPIVAHSNMTIYAKYKYDQDHWSGISSYVVSNMDRDKPSTTHVNWTDPDTHYVDVNLTALDSHSGIANTYYTVNDDPEQAGTNIQLRTQGLNSVTYWSVDVAGNIEDNHNFIVEVQLLPVGENGHFDIQDMVKFMNQGTLQQKDMNNDGNFDSSDVEIMLHAISTIH